MQGLAIGPRACEIEARSFPMELKDIVFEKAAVATLTVNRPNALNALNRNVLEEISR